MSQGDIEKETGLLRAYVSRVENGHTIPTIETLEKWARALKMPLYQIFYDGEEPAPPPEKPTPKDENLYGNSGSDAAQLHRLRQSLSKMNPKDRQTLLTVASKMAGRKKA